MTQALVFAVISLIGFTAALAQGAAGREYVDPEAYAVYSVLVPQEWAVRVAKAKKVVIQVETTDYAMSGDIGMSGRDCVAPAKGEEAVWGPVIAAYREANAKSWRLQRNFKMAVGYVLVPDSTIRLSFSKGSKGWVGFYQKHPDSGGYISLSAVGFNGDKSLAMVYTAHACGMLCGGGHYNFLKKTEGMWAKVEWKGNSCTWAS